MISIVTAGRNDNYGGDFLGRVAVAYAKNRELQKYHGVDIEWIFVEWNPIDDQYASYILSKMGWTCYVVDPAIHESVLHSDYPDFNNGFFLSYSKNVGVRRAKGDWIVLSNPDVIYDNSIWGFFCSSIERGALYRAKRRDIEIQEVNNLFGSEKILKEHGAPGDFLMFSADTKQGFDESINDARIHQDSRFMLDYMVRNNVLTEEIGCLYKIVHPLVWWKTRNKYAEMTHTKVKWGYRKKVGNGPGLYENPPDWGFANNKETEIADGITYIHAEKS